MTAAPRVTAAGKFIRVDDRATPLRGVTYGSFAETGGVPYPPRDIVARDFRAIASMGANTVRTYTIPPPWLLDLAAAHDLLVLPGLAWESHVAFLDEGRHRAILERLRHELAPVAGHPAIACYAIGNEIPASIVRWHGRERTERFLERLANLVRDLDSDALVTYVNYPSTEYLDLPFLDVVAFNVFLESLDRFEAYLARLQNIAGDRPLIVAELGLDSRRNGEQAQARVVRQQLDASFSAGCAGAFVFAWTDEWHRGGVDVEDWSFGLTDRARQPKPALVSATDAFSRAGRSIELAESQPFVSVVVCSRNGAERLPECLQALQRLAYPGFEIVVVDDHSTDATAEVARGYGVRVAEAQGAGLSAARNTGIAAARGEIVAFIDDDAWPEPGWLGHLVRSFGRGGHAGVGGPNVPPPGRSLLETAVASAPGGPIHVMLSDTEAEHVPGCNMAFRKSALVALGGFDPQFTIAGDDVDICWRVLDRGWTLGYSPGAMVWHRRRSSVRPYVRQQFQYGRAEALLERKWPEKYNCVGHVAWSGRVYGGLNKGLARRWRVYYGTWASSLFQSLYDRGPSATGSVPLLPEWYLLVGVLAAVTALDTLRGTLLLPIVDVPALLLLLAAVALALLFNAARGARAATRGNRSTGFRRFRLVVMTTALFMLQPLARLSGRLGSGLTPWRTRGTLGFRVPVPGTRTDWSETWTSLESRLTDIERRLRPRAMLVERGGDFDRWDLQVRVGPLGAARLRAALEEHGQGRQLTRLRIWPVWSRSLLFLLLPVAAWAGLVLVYADALEAGVVAAAAGLLLVRAAHEAGSAIGLLHSAIDRRLPVEESAAPVDLDDPDVTDTRAVRSATPTDDRRRPRRREPAWSAHTGFAGALEGADDT